MLGDIEVWLPSATEGLAALASATGRAGVSLEGGGMSVVDGVPLAHFLVDDAAAACAALSAAGLGCRVNDVAMLHLAQDVPGQLAACLAAVAGAGVTLRAQYSDHAGALVLVPEPEHLHAAREVARRWEQERAGAAARSTVSRAPRPAHPTRRRSRRAPLV